MRGRFGFVRLCGALAIVAVAGVASWRTPAALSASYETLCWEAENHATITAPLFVGPRKHPDDVAPTKAGPSGGKFVRSDMDSKNDSGGKVVYKVRVGGGKYALWARRYWPSPHQACANTFHINVDGKRVGTLGEDATYDAWIWTMLKTPATISLTPGIHTIEFEHSEHGAIVDQILLTTRTTRYVPGGRSLPVKVTPGVLQK